MQKLFCRPPQGFQSFKAMLLDIQQVIRPINGNPYCTNGIQGTFWPFEK